MVAVKSVKFDVDSEISVECRVEFDYDAQQEDELSIKPGEIIKNVTQQDGGWWEGELNGKRGMFPDNFVKIIKPEAKSKASSKSSSKDSAKTTPNTTDDFKIMATTSEPGQSGVKSGPSVKELKNQLSKQVSLQGTGRRDTKKKKLARVRATQAYTADEDDELSFDVGDIIEVTDKDSDNWWRGQLVNKDLAGSFPVKYTELLDDDEHDYSAEVTEIQPKKVKGVGLGDIFKNEPIKLRSTKKEPGTKASSSSPDESVPVPPKPIKPPLATPPAPPCTPVTHQQFFPNNLNLDTDIQNLDIHNLSSRVQNLDSLPNDLGTVNGSDELENPSSVVQNTMNGGVLNLDGFENFDHLVDDFEILNLVNDESDCLAVDMDLEEMQESTLDDSGLDSEPTSFSEVPKSCSDGIPRPIASFEFSSPQDARSQDISSSDVENTTFLVSPRSIEVPKSDPTLFEFSSPTSPRNPPTSREIMDSVVLTKKRRSRLSDESIPLDFDLDESLEDPKPRRVAFSPDELLFEEIPNDSLLQESEHEIYAIPEESDNDVNEAILEESSSPKEFLYQDRTFDIPEDEWGSFEIPKVADFEEGRERGIMDEPEPYFCPSDDDLERKCQAFDLDIIYPSTSKGCYGNGEISGDCRANKEFRRHGDMIDKRDVGVIRPSEITRNDVTVANFHLPEIIITPPMESGPELMDPKCDVVAPKMKDYKFLFREPKTDVKSSTLPANVVFNPVVGPSGFGNRKYNSDVYLALHRTSSPTTLTSTSYSSLYCARNSESKFQAGSYFHALDRSNRLPPSIARMSRLLDYERLAKIRAEAEHQDMTLPPIASMSENMKDCLSIDSGVEEEITDKSQSQTLPIEKKLEKQKTMSLGRNAMAKLFSLGHRLQKRKKKKGERACKSEEMMLEHEDASFSGAESSVDMTVDSEANDMTMNSVKVENSQVENENVETEAAVENPDELDVTLVEEKYEEEEEEMTLNQESEPSDWVRQIEEEMRGSLKLLEEAKTIQTEMKESSSPSERNTVVRQDTFRVVVKESVCLESEAVTEDSLEVIVGSPREEVSCSQGSTTDSLSQRTPNLAEEEDFTDTCDEELPSGEPKKRKRWSRLGRFFRSIGRAARRPFRRSSSRDAEELNTNVNNSVYNDVIMAELCVIGTGVRLHDRNEMSTSSVYDVMSESELNDHDVTPVNLESTRDDALGDDVIDRRVSNVVKEVYTHESPEKPALESTITNDEEDLLQTSLLDAESLKFLQSEDGNSPHRTESETESNLSRDQEGLQLLVRFMEQCGLSPPRLEESSSSSASSVIVVTPILGRNSFCADFDDSTIGAFFATNHDEEDEVPDFVLTEQQIEQLDSTLDQEVPSLSNEQLDAILHEGSIELDPEDLTQEESDLNSSTLIDEMVQSIGTGSQVNMRSFERAVRRASADDLGRIANRVINRAMEEMQGDLEFIDPPDDEQYDLNFEEEPRTPENELESETLFQVVQQTPETLSFDSWGSFGLGARCEPQNRVHSFYYLGVTGDLSCTDEDTAGE